MAKVVCKTSWANTEYNIGKASDENVPLMGRIKYNHKLHICLKLAPHIGEDHQCSKCMAEY